MNTDLRHFILSVSRVVIPTLLVVATIAFWAIPFALGHHPGESANLPHLTPH